MNAIQFPGEWLIRSVILILAGALLVWLLRVRNPSVRLAAYTALLAGSMAIPMLRIMLPSLKIMPARAAVTVPSEAFTARPGIPETVSIPAPPPPISRKPIDWMRLAALAYAGVAGSFLLRLFAGLLMSLAMLRRSRATGIAENVRESDAIQSPVTIGILRPAILLPAGWRAWESAKREAVLAHERSHVRRHDPALQFVSAIHRAILWASPASWYLDRAIVRTAEEVSDDDAVAAMPDRVSYAEILLDFVQRGVGQRRWQGVPMARYERPVKRIRRILNATGVPARITGWSIAAILGLGAPLAYLAAAAQSQSLAFEVASVKPAVQGHVCCITIRPGARVEIRSLSLKALITVAFRVSSFQVSGGDAWVQNDRYDVEAKPSEDSLPSIKTLRYTWYGIEDEHLREMLQTLLIERFHLQFHVETRTGDVYLLEQSGKPLALHATDKPGGGADPAGYGNIGYVNDRWSIYAYSMPQLAKFAADVIFHVPVHDRTGLTGPLDYKQKQPDLEPNYGPDQTDTFQHFLAEMGLKVEHTKGPVESFIIDHAATPTPN